MSLEDRFDELVALAQANMIALSDEEIEAISGGGSRADCHSNS